MCLRVHMAFMELISPVIIDGPLTGHKDITYRILVLGSKGSLVQIVQNRLQAAGYYKGQAMENLIG